MNYIKMSKFDTANGIGIGIVLWVSGCTHKCPGCHNPQTWDFNAGKPFEVKDLRDLLDSLSNEHIKRLTLSGGDPLMRDNLTACTNVAKNVKLLYPEKSIWLYTGYRYEDIIDLDILNYVDVLVDGKFDMKCKDISLPWCGSTNQRVIDLKSTRELKYVVTI